MRSSCLFIALLFAPCFFASPLEAQLIALSPCCVSEAGTHPPETHPPDYRQEEEETPPVLVPAQVRSRDERALQAAAEASIPVEAPLVDAIGVLPDGPGISEPTYVPAPVLIVPPLPLPVDSDDHGQPCCQTAGEPHPPDRDPDETPPLVAAEVRSPNESALEAAAEAPIPADAPRADAIGPLEEGPGVSEPEFVPALLIALLVALLLAIGLLRGRRRRSRPELIHVPDSHPPLPKELSRLLETPVPLIEPLTKSAVEASPALELGPA